MCLIIGVERFGDLLEAHRVGDLITTNVDNGLESLLTQKNSFYTEDSKWSREHKFSICRKKQFHRGQYNLNMWKMHGDIDNAKTVLFGYDQYCGSLSKIESYIKGNYSVKDVKNKVTMIEKCWESKLFDGISWIE